jgi:hypothetical protein
LPFSLAGTHLNVVMKDEVAIVEGDTFVCKDMLLKPLGFGFEGGGRYVYHGNKVAEQAALLAQQGARDGVAVMTYDLRTTTPSSNTASSSTSSSQPAPSTLSPQARLPAYLEQFSNTASSSTSSPQPAPATLSPHTHLPAYLEQFGSEPTASTAESVVCAICSEKPAGPIGELDCGHQFCLTCIRQWVEDGASTCPICRSVVTVLRCSDAAGTLGHTEVKPRDFQAPVRTVEEVASSQDQLLRCFVCRDDSNAPGLQCDLCEQVICLTCIPTARRAAARRIYARLVSGDARVRTYMWPCPDCFAESESTIVLSD